MIVLNKYGREVQINSKILAKIQRRGNMNDFQKLPCKTICNGSENHIALLLGENGIGDDIHAMPAVWQKIQQGYTIDVYSRDFTRECYESVGANFTPYR